jgi:transposase
MSIFVVTISTRRMLPMITREVWVDIKTMQRSGLSIRKIARTTGLHRKTVAKYIECDALPEYTKRQQRKSILDPYRQIIEGYLEEDAYQATWIFDRLNRMGYRGSYTTVKTFVQSIKEKKTRIAYIRFETEPARQAQVDWGDFQIQQEGGKITTIYAFVMVMGYSRALYVEFVERPTLEAFMDCHIHAFHFFGGIPQEALYDNMKHVVTGKQNGRPVLNIEFLHFAHHYGFSPKLCPPYSPWVKGKVERPMDYIRERFWRGYAYTSLARTNDDVKLWLESANKRIHGTHHQAVCERWEKERDYLGSLPLADYDTSIKLFRKVHKDCRFSYNANIYLVPHSMAGKRVMLKIKGKMIRIFYDQDLLAVYEEPDGKHTIVGVSDIYASLRADRSQRARKYGKVKGRATRGLVTGSLYPEVATRPLIEYEQYAGGTAWNN